MSQLEVWSFYCFVAISAPEMLLPKLLLIAKKKQIKGTILISKEGFNGSICTTRQNADLLFCEIVNLTNAKDVNLKINNCLSYAFNKLKIKIKKEIVTMGVADLEVQRLKGQYIKPEKWDEFIGQDQVVVLDTRNDYEVVIGTFKGAINPNIKNFRDLPKWLEQNLPALKDKKVAMFCTGGIRCEKSTAYLKVLGANQVYHLEGGILQYLSDTKNKSGIWQGDCFVFDDRKCVDQELNDTRQALDHIS
jgi:UPF0176 protein